MANLQVKNVSASLHRRLRHSARKQNRTLSDLVLTAIERELARSEFHERLAKRSSVELGVSAASLLAEERQQRDQDLA
ncbi:MAG: hypothetical protein ACREQ3_09625 [Candidatus Binatia bacterium]